MAQYKRDAAFAHQPQIQPAALGVGQPVAPGDLPQTGEPGLDLQDFGGVRAIVTTQFAFGDGPRTHQRHFARDHVPQLRKLVDGMAPAEAREAAGNPRILRALEFRPAIVVNVLDPAGRRAAPSPPHMVRSLSIRSGAPCHPTRRCAINGGRPESSHSTSAQTASKGSASSEQDDGRQPLADRSRPARSNRFRLRLDEVREGIPRQHLFRS